MIDHAVVSEMYEREIAEPPPGLEIPNKFPYMHYKAFAYLTMGPEAYRAQDALGMPRGDLPAARLASLRRGCEQIVAWAGTTPETALRDLEIEGFHDLVHLFHFDVTSQQLLYVDSTKIDKMNITHAVTGEELSLYTKVPDLTDYLGALGPPTAR